jgi:hypothetical protein
MNKTLRNTIMGITAATIFSAGMAMEGDNTLGDPGGPIVFGPKGNVRSMTFRLIAAPKPTVALAKMGGIEDLEPKWPVRSHTNPLGTSGKRTGDEDKTTHPDMGDPRQRPTSGGSSACDYTGLAGFLADIFDLNADCSD